MKVDRDKETGAVIFRYTQVELKEDLGYRLLQLEKRVDELEKNLKEILELLKELSRW